MDERLWDIIKLLSEREEIASADMALAEEYLDPNVFSILKAHIEKGITMMVDPWL
ncbi:hypothetical protein [Niallia sp. 01092]|uniref:hypothetical protein n=1 Tax=unclassified Niallia TaxID=2837522 RepID=UPI003FCFAFA1